MKHTTTSLTVVAFLACTGRAAGFGQGTPKSAHDAKARAYLEAPAGERQARAAEMRILGPLGGRALLDACLDAAMDPARVAAGLDLLLELLPADASAEVQGLRPRLSSAGRARLLAWLARRDLAGFRDFEAVRARGLLTFLDDESDLALVAARACASFDLDIVAADLRDRLLRALRGDVVLERDLALELAHSFAQLRAAAPLIGEVLDVAEDRGHWLVARLLPALGFRLDLVQAGRLDRYVRARHPALRQAVESVVATVDRELFARVEHAARLELYRRFRSLDPDRAEWALREAHVAVMDLADPPAALPALRALETAPTVAGQRIEAHTLAAFADALAGRNPEPALERALAEPGFSERLPYGDEPTRGADAFVVRLLWRQQVPPRLGDDEVAAWRERYRQSGGSEGLAWREAGRQRLAVLLAAHVLRVLRGDADGARRALVAAVEIYRTLDAEWPHEQFGEPRDLETALVQRSGPIELVTRSLEGNEAVAARIGAGQAKQRLVAAERDFLALVAGLAEALPERVIGLPDRAAPPIEPGGRERAFSDVTGALARFYQRIGEQEKATHLLEHLIARLQSAATHENRRAWAGYLFDRAAIAMDQRDGAVAKEHLQRYVKHYDDLLQDVRQNPDRYINPEAARAWYASQLAAGHISLAVLHNVVLGQIEVAREHCRKAYALEDSPFNRVLYACYLARDGRAAEARALIATVEPSLPLYYNLACTLALAGDREQALRYLELDLRWNHPTRKSRNRQREWARRDHDLAALREDPRFVELVRQRAEGEER